MKKKLGAKFYHHYHHCYHQQKQQQYQKQQQHKKRQHKKQHKLEATNRQKWNNKNMNNYKWAKMMRKEKKRMVNKTFPSFYCLPFIQLNNFIAIKIQSTVYCFYCIPQHGRFPTIG